MNYEQPISESIIEEWSEDMRFLWMFLVALVVPLGHAVTAAAMPEVVKEQQFTYPSAEERYWYREYFDGGVFKVDSSSEWDYEDRIVNVSFSNSDMIKRVTLEGKVTFTRIKNQLYMIHVSNSDITVYNEQFDVVARTPYAVEGFPYVDRAYAEGEKLFVSVKNLEQRSNEAITIHDSFYYNISTQQFYEETVVTPVTHIRFTDMRFPRNELKLVTFAGSSLGGTENIRVYDFPFSQHVADADKGFDDSYTEDASYTYFTFKSGVDRYIVKLDKFSGDVVQTEPLGNFYVNSIIRTREQLHIITDTSIIKYDADTLDFMAAEPLPTSYFYKVQSPAAPLFRNYDFNPIQNNYKLELWDAADNNYKSALVLNNAFYGPINGLVSYVNDQVYVLKQNAKLLIKSVENHEILFERAIIDDSYYGPDTEIVFYEKNKFVVATTKDGSTTYEYFSLQQSDAVVDKMKVWKVTFSQNINMDKLLANPHLIKIVRQDSIGQPLRYTLGANPKTLLISGPINGYPPGNYTLTIDQGLFSTNGKTTSKPYVKNFTVK